MTGEHYGSRYYPQIPPSQFGYPPPGYPPPYPNPYELSQMKEFHPQEKEQYPDHPSPPKFKQAPSIYPMDPHGGPLPHEREFN